MVENERGEREREVWERGGINGEGLRGQERGGGIKGHIEGGRTTGKENNERKREKRGGRIGERVWRDIRVR